MSTSASSNTLVDRVSLRNLIDSARRLDELGIARVIANIAEVVHKQQKGGQPLNTLTPDAIIVQADGDVLLHLKEPKAAYTAPERLRGEPGDRRSDVFSLGAILWEALAHERLFEGEIENEIKASVLEGEYRSASELNANIPAELEVICKKALSRSPADRFPSCKVMAAELATVLDDAGYPEDNSAIADHIATKYTAPEAKPAPVISSRDTPLPGMPIVTNDRPGNQTIQGISPRKEIEAAIELTKKKVDTLVGPTETRPPAEPTPVPVEPPRAKSPSAQPLAKQATHEPVAEQRAKTPSSQPMTDAPRAKTPSKVPTLIGDNPLRAKAPSSQPLTSTAPATANPFTPTASPVTPAKENPFGPAPADTDAPSSLPAWATARSGSPSTAPATTPAPIDPGSTLPGLPTILDKPPVTEPKSFSKTAVLGSLSGVDLLPPAEAAPAETQTPVPIGKKTEVHGSASIADRLAAINHGTGTTPPPIAGLPAMPPGADPLGKTPGITTAETVPTPSLATYAAAEAKAAAALDAVTAAPEAATLVPQPPVLPGASAPQPKTQPPSEAMQMAAAATGTAVAPADASEVHPASVVTLPRPRSKSEGGRAGTEAGSRDPVAGWGWGTGPHETVGHDDDDFYETQRSTKKRLILAIGGAAAAVLLVVVAAFAFGGSKEEKKADVSAKQTEPAVDWSQPTDPPPAPTQPDPNAVDPNAGSAVDPNAGSAVDPNAIANAGSAIDPNAGSAAVDPNAGSAAAMAPNVGSAVEPPKPEPPAPVEVVKTEPPKPEPPKPVAKVEPPKPEPKPVAKVEPKKVEPKKPIAKTEPKKKLEPPKPVAKTDPKHASWDPLAPKKEPKKAPAPVDPYANDTPKKPAVDPNVAYKTGIQQFARGDSAGALSTFKASLAANPGFASTWRGIGMVYEKMGKKSQAKTAFRRYLQLSPSASDAESIRARMERL